MNANTLRQTLLLGTAAVWIAGITNAAELTWWTPNWNEERARELAAKFEEENPDTDIRIEITVSNGLQNRIQVALRSGSTPDVIDSSMQWVIPFASAGGLMPLTDLVTDYDIDIDDLIPATVESNTYEGQLYGLPYRAQTHGLIYNRGMYEEAGLDPDNPPATWDEFMEVVKTLTETGADGEEQYGFGISGGGEIGNLVTRLVPLIWMNGGSIYSEDFSRATINEPAAVEAVAFLTDILTKHQASPPSTIQNDGIALRRLFGTGTIAHYQTGQYDLPALESEAPDVDFGVMLFPHPEGKETAGVLSGWSFIIPAAAQNKEGAKKFVAFMMQPENQGFYTDTFPASRVAMQLPRFDAPNLQPFKEALEYAEPVPQSPAWIQTQQIIFAHVQSILIGNATPQEAMDAAAAEIQDVLDRM